MDWPDDSPDSTLVPGGAADGRLSNQFRFDYPSKYSCRVLQSDGRMVTQIILDSPERWKSWLESPRFKNLRNVPSNNVIDPESGYEILLCARPTPGTVGPPGRQRPVEMGPTSLTFAKEYWHEVTQSLFVHKSIIMATNPGVALSFSALFPTEMKAAEVEVYLACNSGGGVPRKLAISSTHFIKSRFTTAVLYGCDVNQMDHVVNLLTRSPDVRHHHLLSIGLFSELQRERLEDRVVDFRLSSAQMMVDFGAFDARNERRMSEDDHWRLNVELRGQRQVAINLAEEIRTVKAHLDTILDSLDENETRISSEAKIPVSDPHNPRARLTKRYKRRLRDISMQYENLAGICQTQLETMTFVRDFSMADYSAREAKASKALGLTAMIYLPITSLATIFAMPIFDWKARWLDFYMTFVPSSSVDGSAKNETAASDTTDPGATAVLSGYFWIYLAISIITTMLTVAGYMLYAWNWRIPFVMRWVYALMDFLRPIHLHLRNTLQRLSTTAGRHKPGRSRQPNNGITGRHAGVVNSAEGIERVEDNDVTKATHQIHVGNESRGPLGETIV